MGRSIHNQVIRLKSAPPALLPLHTEEPLDMALSKKRQNEIMRLVYEGGDELTAAIELGEKATAKHLRAIHREISAFLKTCEDKDELDVFAANWHRDGREKPIHQLIKNLNVDAGTLLRVYWLSCPEDYYLFHSSASEAEEGFERDVFNTLVRIERRIVKSEYKTAVIPFDPTDHVSMPERHAEFARQIPEIMFQPITGRKQNRG